jgi:uncharacterized membrane protein
MTQALADNHVAAHHDQHELLKALRRKRAAGRREQEPRSPTFGQRVADGVASTVGSWRFIIVQSVLLAAWIVVNVIATIHHWDPYPFILLNLLLSFQAAYTAPLIMMSQNRQAAIDRSNAAHDYDINIKAELEIETLHEKVDLLREQEVVELTRLLREMLTKLEALQQETKQAAGPTPG